MLKISSHNYDLRDINQVKSMFDVYRPTEVIHTAAKVGGLGSNMNFKGEYFYDNIMINTNVIEQSRNIWSKKISFFFYRHVCFQMTYHIH